jgi:hypothetical protein
MRILKFIFGGGCLLLGLLGCVVSLCAVADPLGTKIADDSDPFGRPASVVGSWVLLIAFSAVASTGAYLLSRLRSSKHAA